MGATPLLMTTMLRRDVSVCAREGRADPRVNVRTQLSKLRPSSQGRAGGGRRKDQGYLRLDENLVVTKDLGGSAKGAEADKPRFNDKLAKDTSEFIWNSDWRKELDTWEKKSGDGGRGTGIQLNDGSRGGGLSLARVAELNDMDTDLSERLRARPNPPRAESASAAPSNAPRRAFPERPGGKQTSRWERSSKFTVREDEKTMAQRTLVDSDTVQASRSQYGGVKSQLYGTTFVTGFLGTGLCFWLYDGEVAASFGIGSLFSLLYLRLLSRSVDSVAAEDAATQIGGASGQARLLVPAVLILGYNKWHTYAIETYGFHASLFALLAGFFAYKAGIFGEVFTTVASIVRGEGEGEGEGESPW